MDYLQILKNLGATLPLYAVLFLGATLLVFISRGTTAWTGDKLRSGIANISLILFNSLFGWVFLLPLLPLINLVDAPNFPSLGQEFCSSIPLPLTVLILLFAYDFVIYWVHRIMHVSYLWPVHAIHHSDTDMHFLTWGRTHPLETCLINLGLLVGLSWMGLSVADIVAAKLIRDIHQSYVHSNVDWDHGPFKWLITSPQLHRWHHVDLIEAYDKNFASIFPVYDKLFGTYYFPGSAVDKPTGFPETPKNDVIKLLAFPFLTWVKMFTVSKKQQEHKDASVRRTS